jgi:hypothetical protein
MNVGERERSASAYRRGEGRRRLPSLRGVLSGVHLHGSGAMFGRPARCWPHVRMDASRHGCRVSLRARGDSSRSVHGERRTSENDAATFRVGERFNVGVIDDCTAADPTAAKLAGAVDEKGDSSSSYPLLPTRRPRPESRSRFPAGGITSAIGQAAQDPANRSAKTP